MHASELRFYFVIKKSTLLSFYLNFFYFKLFVQSILILKFIRI